MRSMRVLAMSIIAMGVMVVAGCGNTAQTGSSKEMVASTSNKPVASQKQAPNSQGSQSSGVKTGNAGKLPKGLKTVTTQSVPPKTYPLQYWLEPRGVVNGEYRIVVHLWAIKPVSKYKLFFSTDSGKKMVPRMVDGPSGLHQVEGDSSGNPLLELEQGSLGAGDGLTFTVAYPASLQKDGGIAVVAWTREAQVSNGRIFNPSSGINQ